MRKQTALRHSASGHSLIIIACLFFCLGQQSTPLLSSDSITISPIYGNQERTAYHRALLDKALNLNAAPGKKTTIEFLTVGPRIGSARKASMLLQGKYDLIWAPPRPDLENNALRVNFPFMRGLRGYRILLVHKDIAPQFAGISNIHKLAHYKAGLGNGWTDVDVFLENKLPVVTAPSPDGLWRMLQAHRFDYYPRGLTEIMPEFKAHQDTFPTIKVDSNLVLYYPFPLFYYVRKDRVDLHEKMTSNLNQLYQSGDFYQLWFSAHKNVLKRLSFEKRTVIQLKTSHLASLKKDWPQNILLQPQELKDIARSIGSSHK